ncbi:MAG: DUF2271 domain-containing protein [Bacteroidetes bacterium]|nr:DUF2271 domain-containing protein [Bacteroidota bacterium]
MRRKFTISLSIAILAIFFINVQSFAQTAGTLTCNFTTASTGGYSPKHCIAVWIETNSGTFIKTKYKMCSSGNYDHLSTWTGKSGSSIVDATAGSTRTANGALSIVWNGTDVAAAVVADGVYKVWVEFAWASSSKLVTSFSFTKGSVTDHQAPADYTSGTGSLTAITLDWVPAVGVADVQKPADFTIYPNPVTNQSKINYTLTSIADVTISLFDVTGKLINVLFDENQAAGTYSLPISTEGRLTPGVYFVRMNTGRTQHTEKIIITE